MFSKILISTVLLAWSISYSQTYPIRFVMGVYTPVKNQNEVTFRCSSSFNQLARKSKGYLQVNWRWPKVTPIVSIWDTEIGTTFTIDSVGILYDYDERVIDKVNIDTRFWENSIPNSNLISFGDIKLKSSQKKKVKWLQYYPTFGDINSVAAYSNVEYLILSETFSIPFLSDLHNKVSHYYYTNQGITTFNSSLIEKLRKLKYLEIQIHDENNRVQSYSEHRNEFLLSAGLPSSVINLPELSMLKLTGCSFLPVNFHDFEKFNFLEFTMVQHAKPELANLAIVMNYYGKDTSGGNWAEYLDDVMMDSSYKIPMNGTYKSYYKNGQPLCNGNFVNGLPDGEWCFWYEDGLLSEKRTYNLGLKSGEWYFISDSATYRDQNLRDTILYLQFRQDTLLSRIDKTILEFSEGIGCYDYHGFTYDLSKSTSVLNFFWKDSDLYRVQHNFINQGLGQLHRSFASWKGTDTINGYLENWYLGDTSWYYDYSNFTNICPNVKKEIEYKSSGKMGELASYSWRSEKGDWSFEDQYQWIYEFDFTKGIASFIECERTKDNNEYKESRRHEVKLEDILPKIYID